MTGVSGGQLAELLNNFFLQCNDISDIWSSDCEKCNYENFEDFCDSNDLEFFQQDDFGNVFKEVNKCATEILINGHDDDICEIFDEATLNPLKFNLLVWYKLENGKRSDSTPDEVQQGVLIASCYIAMSSMKGSHAAKLFQVALLEKCLKIMQNCCRTIRSGEIGGVGGIKKKGAVKKGAKKPAEETVIDEDAEGGVIAIGPPRISTDKAEDYLQMLTTQLFGFSNKEHLVLNSEILLKTLEMIEDLGRIDLDFKNATRAPRANSVREFRSIEKFVDRYSAFLHVMTESKYESRKNAVYARIVRPRLALMPFPEECSKVSKISTERKRAGDLATSFIIARLGRKPPSSEIKLIKTVLEMVYFQCPDLQEFRTNICGFICKVLASLPYQFQYDFVQTMNILAKGKTSGVRQLSIELAVSLIFGFDFSAPDPGPISNDAEDDEDEEMEEESEESDESGVNDEEEDEPMDEGDDEDQDKSKNKSKMKNKTKKQKKVKKGRVDEDSIPRCDASTILYRIIYMAALDKSAPSRLHAANSLSKILESEKHRKMFQECCQKMNLEKDEKFGEINENLNESMDQGANVTRSGGAKEKKSVQKNDLQLEEHNIIQKLKKLQMMNKGEARVEDDVIFMVLRRLATDEKAPVRKSACSSLRQYLSFCDEPEKFEVVISILEKMCRDKMVTVRKMGAETMTELMLREQVLFKEVLSSKWLNSMILLLDDNENEVQEHSRKLIMKVITPLLENTNELTWALLETIETNTNHRHCFMTLLKDATNEKLVKANVMEIMKKHLEEGIVNKASVWMVLSQLSVEFKQNIDYAINAYYSVDLGADSKLLKYIVHVITSNVKKISVDSKKDLKYSVLRTLKEFSFDSSHAKDVFYLAAKLIDGVGDDAKSVEEFKKFGEELLTECFDTIVDCFQMFKKPDEWTRNSDSYEKKLISALNVASEVFLFCPKLVPQQERLSKTLSLIVNSNDNRKVEEINPDMPSVHNTRPQTQMSDVISSQHRTGGAATMIDEGSQVLFSDRVRAVAVITLANMIIAHDKMLKLMPMFVKQLQINPSHEIRSNIVVAIGDICETYKTDRYSPVLAACLCDPSVIVRRHAINEIARLIASSIFRFAGEVMIRLMLAILDANEDVRNDAKLYISEVLQHEIPNFFPKHFVHYMIYLTQAKRIVHSSHAEDDNGHVDVTIGGGDPLARSSRIAVYNFVIESLDDRGRFEVKKDICLKIINPITNGEFDFSDHNTNCLLDDALLIMASNEMQVKMEVGKSNNENGIEEPSADVVNAASDFMRTVYLQNYMDHIIPTVLNLREFLNQHRSPLQRKCQLVIRMICLEHKNDLDTILRDNRQLKDEMTFELQRVKQRAEEANRILDEHLKKISEFNKKQRRMSRMPQEHMEEEDGEVEDVHMTSPTTSGSVPAGIAITSTPKNSVVPGTPRSARNRPLSPKTIKKIRRSVGLLITENQLAMNPPVLDETRASPIVLPQVTEVGESPEVQVPVQEAPSQDKVEEEKVEDAGTTKKASTPEPKDSETTKKASTPEPEDPETTKKASTPEPEDSETTKKASTPEPEDPETTKKASTSEPEDPESTKKQSTPEPEVSATPEAEASSQSIPEVNGSENRSRSRRRKTPTPEEHEESLDHNGKTWKKPKISNSPTTVNDEATGIGSANISANVTLRRSRRTRNSVGGKVEENEKKKAKLDEEKELADETKQETPKRKQRSDRDETPINFDTTVLPNWGRHCSTPTSESGEQENASEVTFDLNLSAINQTTKDSTTKRSVVKRKTLRPTMAGILEKDDE